MDRIFDPPLPDNTYNAQSAYHKEMIHQVLVLPTAGKYATCGRDGTLRVWSAQTRRHLHTIQIARPGAAGGGPPAWVTCGTETPRTPSSPGGVLAVGCMDRSLTLVDQHQFKVAPSPTSTSVLPRPRRSPLTRHLPSKMQKGPNRLSVHPCTGACLRLHLCLSLRVCTRAFAAPASPCAHHADCFSQRFSVVPPICFSMYRHLSTHHCCSMHAAPCACGSPRCMRKPLGSTSHHAHRISIRKLLPADGWTASPLGSTASLCARVHTLGRMHSHLPTHPQAHTHTHAGAEAPSHLRAHAHAHARTHARTHAQVLTDGSRGTSFVLPPAHPRGRPSSFCLPRAPMHTHPPTHPPAHPHP